MDYIIYFIHKKLEELNKERHQTQMNIFYYNILNKHSEILIKELESIRLKLENFSTEDKVLKLT